MGAKEGGTHASPWLRDAGRGGQEDRCPGLGAPPSACSGWLAAASHPGLVLASRAAPTKMCTQTRNS